MTDKAIKWTPQQRLAIEHRASDIVVTASAGTGKTSVLSGRCADIAADRHICPDIRSLLVLTFTKAAAGEMRSRIWAALREKFTKSQNNDFTKYI